MRSYLVLIGLIAFISSCQKKKEMPISYLPDHANWEEERMSNLYAEDGFINLAGLYWVEVGEWSFGSDPSNDVVFPSDLPSHLGSLVVTHNRVLLTPGEDSAIQVDGEKLDRPTVVYDEESDEYTEMISGDYKWHFIERAGNLGIRVRNLKHPALENRAEIGKFPVSYDWVVEATYVPYEKPKKVVIDNVVGFTYEMDIPGQLQFELGDKEFTLEPIQEGDKFFLIFSDETSALETYGSGRYMYADMPKEAESVILDFNKCYNPPCAFTDFATCLIPPKENRLALRVEAGEKDFHMEH